MIKSNATKDIDYSFISCFSRSSGNDKFKMQVEINRLIAKDEFFGRLKIISSYFTNSKMVVKKWLGYSNTVL
jgi:hypothetical protein